MIKDRSIHIDKRSPVPVYYQLKNIIQKKIQNSEYITGEMIPSERELSESLGISRMTVRQAINQLVVEGTLYREKGKGTFVSKSKIEQQNIMSFSDIVRMKGLIPSSRVLYFGRMISSDDIASILELNAEEPVYVLKRLRLADNIPVAIEEDFLPCRYFSNFEKYDHTSSLYKLIKDIYRYSITYVDSRIQASMPSKDEKDLLEIPANVPVLRINGINYNETDQKLFYEKSVYRSDEFKYSVRVNIM